jgi:deoxyribonuclease V
MKLPPALHQWNVSAAEAVAIQKELAGHIDLRPPGHALRRAAGLDCAFTADDRFCVAGVVLWDIVEKKKIEQHTAFKPLHFPYVPGLLSFREAPALLTVLKKLQQVPDVLICDGQGIAHPRRMGIAAHLGIFTGIPSIGCAKSRLTGLYTEPAAERGSRSPLYHKAELIGMVVRTRDRVRPLFISPGHRIDLTTAVETVLSCGVGYRLPEPTRLADKLVGERKRRGAREQA